MRQRRTLTSNSWEWLYITLMMSYLRMIAHLSCIIRSTLKEELTCVRWLICRLIRAHIHLALHRITKYGSQGGIALEKALLLNLLIRNHRFRILDRVAHSHSCSGRPAAQIREKERHLLHQLQMDIKGHLVQTSTLDHQWYLDRH